MKTLTRVLVSASLVGVGLSACNGRGTDAPEIRSEKTAALTLDAASNFRQKYADYRFTKRAQHRFTRFEQAE